MLDCMRGVELPPHMQIEFDLEKCRSQSDVERIEATLAKLRVEQGGDAWLAKFKAAAQDDAEWLALFAEVLETAKALAVC
jgi:hypothetical protein